MDDRFVDVLRTVIWRRRRAFYDDAVVRNLITAEQAEALMMLNLERDDAQDRREAEKHGE